MFLRYLLMCHFKKISILLNFHEKYLKKNCKKENKKLLIYFSIKNFKKKILN